MSEAEETYRVIFENTGTATIIVEEDMTISLANREFERLSGYSKEEIEGRKRWTEFVMSSDLDRMKEYHAQRRKTPETSPRQYEFRFIDKQGAVKYIVVTADIIPGTKRSVASLLDITYSKKAEEKLDSISMELSISLFEVFDALKKISTGDPEVSISEESEIELIAKLKHTVNETAKNIGEMVEQSHEFAMVLAEHFDIFQRVSKGDLTARVSGESKIELLEALRDISNEMIASIEREIRHRRQAEQVLHDREAYLNTIMATIQAGVMIVDCEKHQVVDINKEASLLIGAPREEIIGKECHEYVCPAERGKCPITDLNQVIDNTERALINTKNEKIPILKTVVPIILNNRKYLLETFIDITERKRMEEKLERISITDSLTQAYNRTKYQEVMKAEIERIKRYGRPLSLVMFDIDHFKKINDTYGHDVGDSVLKTLARIVQNKSREIDCLIRWGGEEFIIIAPETDSRGAAVMAEKIRKAVESHKFDTAGKVTVSFGVTEMKREDTEDSLIKRADQAMYTAKEKGRNRVEIY